MSEPRPIEPQDIRVGMRVRRTLTLESGRTLIDEFTVRAVAGGAIDFDDHAGFAADHRATWTLLADAPAPARPVGSHWLDPETGAEYVQTDVASDLTCITFRKARQTDLLKAGTDDAIIARLTAIPAFDPAALWHPALLDDEWCPAQDANSGYGCSRPAGHDGWVHAAYEAYDNRQELGPLLAVWGDPR